MMSRIKWCVAIVSLLSVAGAASAADTLASVEKKIADKFAKYKSVQYKSKGTFETETSGTKTKSTMDVEVQFARKGKGWQLRTEMTTASTQTTKGKKPVKSKTKMLTIYDGKFNYTLLDNQGQKSATKMKADPAHTMDPFDATVQFKLYRKMFTSKLLADDKVGGKPAYAVEMKTKKPSEYSPPQTVVSYYDKKTGVILKSITRDKAGKQTAASITSDIKIDAKIKPDRFVFKLPEGVELTDMTKPQGGQAPPAEKKAEEPESEQPKDKEPEQEKKPEKKKKKKGLKGLFNKLK